MINVDQIEEWIHEVEERPGSAPLIIRYISSRLRDLSSRNEELLAENIELRTGRKVEDYESRIANLEYQLDLLKRQLSGEMALNIQGPMADAIILLAYNIKGQVLRFDLPFTALEVGSIPARLANPTAGGPPRLLVTHPAEELLFVFDSGRTETLAVQDLPSTSGEDLAWSNAYLAEPHGAEELAVILPVARMTLFDCCVQTSRRGYAKRMMKNAFESNLSKSFIGSGVKVKLDKPCNLVLSGIDEQIVLVSREGYLLSLEVNTLPYTAEEIIRLGAMDYIVSSFVPGRKASFLVITQNGKVIHRETTWLEKANSFKSRGQAVFSQSRRDAGVRVAGAVPVDESDWGVSLDKQGRIVLHKVANLLANGSLENVEETVEILDFAVFGTPSNGNV